MEIRKNKFLKAIKAGDKQIGLWISLCSNFASEVVAPAGYDWVLIDMEHSANDYFSVLSQLQCFEAYETTALVRPDWNDTVIIKRLMDLGVPGLLFPMVQSVEEAEKAVAATRYPPKGVRGVSGSTRATKFGRVTDYAKNVDDETAVLLQIETKAALEIATDIAAVEGVDGIFFGPNDIAADMGLFGKAMDDRVWDAIMPVAKKLMDMGMPVGTLVTNAEFSAKLLNEGFTFVACGTDTGLLSKASDALLASVKKDMK